MASGCIPPLGQRRLPAVLMRSGTSRGLFLHRHHLPESQHDWAPILIAAMGSRSNDPRQLEGVGGGTSTTSKVVVVHPSTKPGIDVEYTFVQVAVGAEVVDMTGNCGNMSSGVAAFALDEGLVRAEPGQTERTVRIYNTNTDATLVETIRVDPATGKFDEDGDYRIAGVKRSGSPVKVQFVSPGGSMTGATFPTGQPQQMIHVSGSERQSPFSVRASLVDVSNPFVFVDASTMPAAFHGAAGPDSEQARHIVEMVRRQAAVAYGFASDTETAGLRRGTPKIALLFPPSDAAPPSPVSDGSSGLEHKGGLPADIRVLSYSMGKVHPSFQLTGAVCLGAATCLQGTVAADLRGESRLPPTPPLQSSDGGGELPPPSETADTICSTKEVGLETAQPAVRRLAIQHPSGTMDVEVQLAEDGMEAASVTVYRTVKKVFEGTIFV